jgi:hypothetical protein
MLPGVVDEKLWFNGNLTFLDKIQDMFFKLFSVD